MTTEAGELLKRISATLKADIGPEVGNEFAKTQAFMASVVLDKLSKQLTLEAAHSEAERADVEQLVATLEPVLEKADGSLAMCLAEVQRTRSVASLGPLLEALYAQPGQELQDALALIRPVLRRDIDRRMEIAR